MDEWNSKQLQYLEMGGNKQLSEFLQAYNLEKEQIPNKYKSCAAEYYRAKLNAIVEGTNFDRLPPSCEEGKKEMSEIELAKSQEMTAVTIAPEQEEKKEDSKGVKGTISYFLKAGVNAVVTSVKTTTARIKGDSIGEKIKSAGVAIADKTKGAGLYAYDKAKNVASSLWGKGQKIIVRIN